jgi:hypothetical protein
MITFGVIQFASDNASPTTNAGGIRTSAVPDRFASTTTLSAVPVTRQDLSSVTAPDYEEQRQDGADAPTT